MFYLPRICEHCLNPSCAASCPSGAIYKRDGGRHRPGRPGPLPRLADVHHRLPVQEDLLQPQDRQGREVHVLLPAHRGRASRRCARRPAWAGCATSGWCSTTPTRCSRPPRRRTTPTSTRRSVGVFLDPSDPEVRREAEAAGIPGDWIEAAQRIPGLRADHGLQGGAAAAPGVPHHADGLVHPAAVAGRRRRQGHRLRRRGRRQPLRRDRRPADPGRVPRQPLHRRRRRAGQRRAARSSPRCAPTCATSTSAATPATRSRPRSGWRGRTMYDMFRLLALAKYDERYVIPTAHAEQAHALEELATDCAVSEYGGGQEIFGEGSGPRRPRSRSRTSGCCRSRQTGRHDGGAAARQPAARAGQPAQLGRQGDAGRALPAGRPEGRRAGRPMKSAAARADAQPGISERRTWPTPGRSSRCCSTTPTTCSSSRVPMLRGVVGGAARRAAATPLAELLDHLEHADLR